MLQWAASKLMMHCSFALQAYCVTGSILHGENVTLPCRRKDSSPVSLRISTSGGTASMSINRKSTEGEGLERGNWRAATLFCQDSTCLAASAQPEQRELTPSSNRLPQSNCSTCPATRIRDLMG